MEKELKMLRAAVACHPHAFYRLLENAYGQKGVTRWKLIQVHIPYTIFTRLYSEIITMWTR